MTHLRSGILLSALILGLSGEKAQVLSEALPIGTESFFSAVQVSRLRCRCCGRAGMDAEFAHRLMILQKLWGRPLVFSSGVRCRRHNAEVGGVKNSRHLRGQAADVLVAAREQPRFCALARRAGIRRVLPDRKRGYVHLSL